MDSRFLQYATSLFASFCLLITHYDLSSSVENLLSMMPSDSDPSSSVEHLSTMMPFDSPSSVETFCDKFLLTRNSFNSLSSVEQMCKYGAVISVSYSVNVRVEGISSNHTLHKLSC